MHARQEDFSNILLSCINLKEGETCTVKNKN